jgi:hypothetical protein
MANFMNEMNESQLHFRSKWTSDVTATYTFRLASTPHSLVPTYKHLHILTFPNIYISAYRREFPFYEGHNTHKISGRIV